MTVPFSSAEMRRRIENLKKKMQERSLDCVLAMSYHHSYYLSGAPIFPFGRPVVTVVPSDGDAAMVIGYLEKAHTERQSWIRDLRVYWDVERPPWESALLLTKDLLIEKGIGNGKIGFEDEEMPAAYLDYLRMILPHATFLGVSDALNSLRMIKSDEELSYIRIASDIVDTGMEKFLNTVKVGETANGIRRRVCDEMTTYALSKYPQVSFLVLGGCGVSEIEKQCGHSAGWVTYGADQKLTSGLNYAGMDAWIWGYWGNVERNLIVGAASETLQRHARDARGCHIRCQTREQDFCD
jgi:Xaa-Pro aminopeptidase